MEIAVVLSFLGASCAVVVTLALAASERRSVPYGLFLAGMSLLALECLCTGLAADAVMPEQKRSWQEWSLVALAALPGPWIGFSMSYARGGRGGLLAHWRWLLALALLIPVGLVVCFREHLVLQVVQPRPASDSVFRLGPLALSVNLLFLLSIVLVLMNLERTFRASVGTMRWRIKFMILGLGMLFAVRAYTSSQVLLFRAVDLALQSLNSAALIVASLLILRSLWRTGHFKVEVYPSQSVLQSSFTLILAGLYLFIVGVLARLVTFLGGPSGFQFRAFLVLVAVVLLAVMLLSERARWRTREFVSRHFQRPFYDYRTVWRTFADRTARCVEQGDLTVAVARLASELFQAQSVTVWLANENREGLAFAASTSVSPEKARLLHLDADEARQVVASLVGQADPMNLDTSREVWVSAVRRCHPNQFPNGGDRFAVPLRVGNELIGLMTLGDRVGGAPFSVQDLDLLKSVSDQAATSLLNLRLTHRLSQAKQLEAFQAMSAFFVHDLKNTASTLSLMLQNLPVHFDDPGFREDALRGISKTVGHLNDLISRLNLLRQELVLHPVESDLNELVTESLKGQEQTLGIEAIKELRPVPKLCLDPAQIQKVVTNLVLNAREAVGSSGRIHIGTNQHDGWAILEVADTGCGMTPEFIQEKLFRPFQTTKKNGIGIGMFHCKLIVEAHRGRIEVESAQGHGTTFRVWLPQGC